MTRWARGDVLWRRVLDGAVLMHMSGEAIAVNPTGAVLWELLDEPLTPAELAGRAAEIFGTTPEQILADIDAFVGDMSARGFLVEVPT